MTDPASLVSAKPRSSRRGICLSAVLATRTEIRIERPVECTVCATPPSPLWPNYTLGLVQISFQVSSRLVKCVCNRWQETGRFGVGTTHLHTREIYAQPIRNITWYTALINSTETQNSQKSTDLNVKLHTFSEAKPHTGEGSSLDHRPN